MTKTPHPDTQAAELTVVENVGAKRRKTGFFVAMEIDPITLDPTLLIGKRPNDLAEVARTFYMFLDFGDILHTLGPEKALRFMAAGIQFTHGNLDPDRIDHLYVVLHRYTSWFFVEGWTDTEDDRLIGFAYRLLRVHILRWPEAAALAAIRFGKPVSTNTFRMRVKRWVAQRQLPPIQFRRRSEHEES